MTPAFRVDRPERGLTVADACSRMRSDPERKVLAGYPPSISEVVADGARYDVVLVDVPSSPGRGFLRFRPRVPGFYTLFARTGGVAVTHDGVELRTTSGAEPLDFGSVVGSAATYELVDSSDYLLDFRRPDIAQESLIISRGLLISDYWAESI